MYFIQNLSICGAMFSTVSIFLLFQSSSSSSLTGFGFDIGIEAEEDGGRHEGLLPPMIQVAWQKTEEYEAVRQFIFRTRGAVIISEAQCITHKVIHEGFCGPQ